MVSGSDEAAFTFSRSLCPRWAWLVSCVLLSPGLVSPGLVSSALVSSALASSLLVACWCPWSMAAPAHFWLSDDGVAPAGPDVPTEINMLQGTVGSLYIWGRPETDKKLRNISLNLVAMQAGIDFIDGSMTMHNATGGAGQRFEYISDSTSSPALTSEETLAQVIGGAPDSIELLQGYTINASASQKGVGNQCVGAETGCTIAGDGQAAWLIATVEYRALVGGPDTDIYLQIGGHGINHESLVPGDYDLNGVVDLDDLNELQTNVASTANLWPDGNDSGRVDAADFTIWRDHFGSVSTVEASSLTSVRFGADPIDGVLEPMYDASADRDVTLPADDPDATITIIAPFASARQELGPPGFAPLKHGPWELGTVAVPEPSTAWLLLTVAAAGWGGLLRFILPKALR